MLRSNDKEKQMDTYATILDKIKNITISALERKQWKDIINRLLREVKEDLKGRKISAKNAQLVCDLLTAKFVENGFVGKNCEGAVIAHDVPEDRRKDIVETKYMGYEGFRFFITVVITGRKIGIYVKPPVDKV